MKFERRDDSKYYYNIHKDYLCLYICVYDIKVFTVLSFLFAHFFAVISNSIEKKNISFACKYFSFCTY